METGNLVRTLRDIFYRDGKFIRVPSGTVGIVIKSKQPTPSLPVGMALVRFEFCESYLYWRQLEIIND